MGLSTGAAALGAGLAGLFGGGGNANPPQQFVPPNLSGAASGALGGIGNMGSYNLYQPNLGQVSSTAQNLFNNPYAPNLQAGAATAGNMGEMAGLGAFGAGGQLYGTGTQVLGTAFDPQQDLYNRTLAQVTQQQNVQNANTGVATSPYGAGLTDMNIGNFNIDWQNQQLNRQTQGLSAADTAFSNAANLQSGGVGSFLQGAGLPYTTFNTIGNNQIGALGSAGAFGAAGANQAQQPIQDYLAYLGYGTNQQNANTNTANAQYGQNLGYGSLAAGGLNAVGAGTGLGWTNYFGGGANMNPYQIPNYQDPSA